VKTLVTNYTFSASAKQVTLTDYPSLKLDQILLITNVTDNIIIYNFADPTAGGTLAGNVLTLLYNTTSMSDSDRLQIFIDDYTVPATEASLTAVQVKIDNTNTLLNVLTAKQDTFNFDISSVNVNTNELEGLTRTVNASITATNNNLVTFNRQLTGQVLAFNNQLSGQVQTLNTQLTGQLFTINQNVSSTNPRLSSIDTKLTTLINQTDGIEGSLNNIQDNTSVKNYNGGDPDSYRTSMGPVSGIEINFFYIWSIEGTSYSGYDQYLQVYDYDSSFLLFTQLIKAGENFKFNFKHGGAGPMWFDSGVVRNSLTPFTHTPGNNDLYLLVRGQEF
jgi:hypothetical protein